MEGVIAILSPEFDGELVVGKKIQTVADHKLRAEDLMEEVPLFSGQSELVIQSVHDNKAAPIMRSQIGFGDLLLDLKPCLISYPKTDFLRVVNFPFCHHVSFLIPSFLRRLATLTCQTELAYG